MSRLFPVAWRGWTRVFAGFVALAGVPVVHAGSGSCPAAGPNTIAAPAAPCTLVTGDSVAVTTSGSIAGSPFGIAVQAGEVAGSIANNGTIDVSATSGAVGIRLAEDSGLSGGIANAGTISATASNQDATGIRLSPGYTLSGGLFNGGEINVLFASGRGRGINISSGGIAGDPIENRGRIAVQRAGGVGSFVQAEGILIAGVGGGRFAAPMINSGTITVDGGDGSVFGFSLLASSVSSSLTNERGGIINVRSKGFAQGVSLDVASGLAEGLFNHGTISATVAEAGTWAAGVRLTDFSEIAGGVTNTGLISGAAANGTADGIFVAADSMISGGIVNSGTISGTTYSLNLQNTSAAFTIEHSGTLSGDVALGINRLVFDGTDVTVDGVISGTSEAVAEIRGTTSFASDLHFDGVGSVSIMPDARLEVRAVRTIVSAIPVVNNGTIAIAAQADQTIVGDYVHGAGAALALEAASPTVYGRLIVEGSADIKELDTIALGITADEFVYGDVLEDVISANTIEVAGDIAVADNSEPIVFRARVDGNTIDLVAAPRVSFRELTSGISISGLTSLSAALDDVITAGNPDGDMRAFFQALPAMGSAREIAGALVQLTPTVQVSTGQFAKASVGMTNAVLGRRIEARGATWSAGDGDDPLARSAAWVMPFSSWTEHDGQGGLSGYEADTWGLGGGVDTRLFSERLLLGLGFSQSSSDVAGDAALNRSRLDVTSRQAFVYADYALDAHTNLGFTAGGGAASIESSRRINVGAIERFAQADYGSWDAFANLDLGRAYAFGPMTTLTPQVRFEYLHVGTGSYTESGGGLALAVQASELDQALLSAGVNVLIEATEQLDITARGAIGVDLIDDDPRATGSFLGGGPAFVLQGLKQDATLVRGGVGMKYRARDGRASFHLRYDAEGRDNYTNQLLSMQFRLRF